MGPLKKNVDPKCNKLLYFDQKVITFWSQCLSHDQPVFTFGVLLHVYITFQVDVRFQVSVTNQALTEQASSVVAAHIIRHLFSNQ